MRHFNEYQWDADSFRLRSARNLDYVLYGLSGEVGELHSIIAKGIRDGYSEGYRDNIKKELGDILWFVAAIAKDFGFTLQEVADANIAKLTARQMNGTIQGSGDNR